MYRNSATVSGILLCSVFFLNVRDKCIQEACLECESTDDLLSFYSLKVKV